MPPKYSQVMYKLGKTDKIGRDRFGSKGNKVKGKEKLQCVKKERLSSQNIL